MPATMTRTITTQEASVMTATVAIKTVTVSKRQLTLSTFRQIKNEEIIDPKTLELLGEPWGIVNYFWRDCHSFLGIGKHLHVLWQKDAELRVAAVALYNLPRYYETLPTRESMAAYRACYDGIVRNLSALDHLFIAV